MLIPDLVGELEGLEDGRWSLVWNWKEMGCMMCVMCCHVHVMCTWLFRLAEGGGLIPVLISCQLRELIHLASWQDSDVHVRI